MITLLGATISTYRSNGIGVKIDNSICFATSTLSKIAKDPGNIFKHKIKFDNTRTKQKKYYQEAKNRNYIKYIPRNQLSTDEHGEYFAITDEGKNFCMEIIRELFSEKEGSKLEKIITLSLSSPSQKSESIRLVAHHGKSHENLEYLCQDCGLNWLHPDYFDFHRSTEKDLENWKKGFSFELPSIKMKWELRREKVIEDITTKLDSEGKLLIVGEPGTSKSTILMEIMCDYFDRGFEILESKL